MILFLILLLMLLIIVPLILLVISIGGVVGIFLFGDVIVCAVIIFWIISRIIKK